LKLHFRAISAKFASTQVHFAPTKMDNHTSPICWCRHRGTV
jgi:hypothetical protein